MFAGSGNFIVTGGTFSQTNPSSKGFEILHGKIATDAFYDSGERFDPPKCHPNTRVAVLAEIMHWIQVIEESEDVLWLYGSAGAGKSAIAQTIAEKCAKLGLLIASFFFSRASQSRNNDKRLIASIAYQLAISIPATRSNIESAVQTDPAIFDKSLETQIETLVIRTLESACAQADARQWPRLIIIDGLDECDGIAIQCSIIRLLSAALRRVPFPLILLVASRPEPHIRNAFNLLIKSASHTSRHIVLDDSYEADADIKEFLFSRFTEIKENHQLGTYIPQSWPSEEIVDQLVRKSSGQFIYASTVMKYLDSRKHRPMKRLDAIMGLIPVVGDMPYKELDALYSHIFSCVEDFGITLKILGYLLFGHQYFRTFSFTPNFLCLLLGLDEEDIYLHLSELHSILYIPPPPNASELGIRPMHASLQDFLVDKLRSGKYYIDEEAFHADLAQQCTRCISSLSINQTLLTLRSLESYLICSFTYHCSRASTTSTSLKADLMQLSDLRPWLETLRGNLPYLDGFPLLFEWLDKADNTKELSNHIQSLWDQYLTSKLSQYKLNGSNVDIAGLLVFPDDWHLRWFSLTSGTIQAPDLFLSCGWVSYQPFLREFFEDKARSGKHHVDGTVYAYAALESLLNMINVNDDEIFNPYPFIVSGIERPDAQLFMSITEDMISQRGTLVPGYYRGLDAVATLLSKAAPLDELYLYLRDHPLQNPAKAKVHCEHGFTKLRWAVKVYLEKCKHLCPKVLRRSTSCPIFSPYIDFGLPSWKDYPTFHGRWPLARDRPGYDWTKTGPLERTRALPEMIALQSRGRNIRRENHVQSNGAVGSDVPTHTP